LCHGLKVQINCASDSATGWNCAL